jgi:hypothetical protein
MRVKVHKVKNLSPKPLDFDILLGSGKRREMHLPGKTISRKLSGDEFNSTTIQSMITKKLLRAIQSYEVRSVEAPAPAPAKVAPAPVKKEEPPKTEEAAAPEADGK